MPPEPTDEEIKKNAEGGTKDTKSGSGGMTDAEKRAHRMGWRSQEEYRGPEADWVDAEAFIEKVEAEVPVLRERNRFLDDQLGQQERQMREQGEKIDELTQVLTEFSSHNKQVAEVNYQKGRADIEAEKRRAVEEADTEAYDKAQERLVALDEAQVSTSSSSNSGDGKDDGSGAAKPPKPSAGEQSYIDKNQDVWKNDRARKWFIDTYGEGRNSGMSEAAAIKAADKEARELFARSLGGGAAGSEDGDDGGSAATKVGKPKLNLGGGKKKKKSFDNLPDDAKELCERFEKLIPDYKRDDYVKQFEWGPEYDD